MNAPILRSVNLREDLAVPSRLKHYHPTPRSLPVTKAVLSGGATMVIAAYGSGKSLAAGIGALVVENDKRNRDLLLNLADKIGVVDTDVAVACEERVACARRGKVVILSGYVRDLPASISAALGFGAADDIEEVIGKIRKVKTVDHVAIIWDEFGRHIEGLVAEGRARELDAVQRLAECAARAANPKVGLTVLLHQNLLAYATALNQTTRNEWRKVEGRFRQVRFVEDSRELYGLMATIIEARRPAGPKPDRGRLRRIAQGVIKAEWFDRMEGDAKVEAHIAKAYPVSAAALQVLPRLVARVGQNERSLFTFLETADLSSPIGLEEVYLAFSEQIRSDVGVGGLHRRWVETESARSKVAETVQREALACAFMLQVGVHGERRHLPRSVLELALLSRGYSESEARNAISVLIVRKLLLYRKLNDDVSIWHGVDVDITSRLHDECMRRQQSFDLRTFLEARLPAHFVRAIRHNSERGTSRYLEGGYIHACDLGLLAQKNPKGRWGKLVFVLCDTADDVRISKEFATKTKLERTVLVVPHDVLAIRDAAIELEALSALRRDTAFLGEDPLVSQELDELLAVARRSLEVSLHRLTSDRPTASTWYHAGKPLAVSRDRPATVATSDLMDLWYPATPRIANDQMMRSGLSRQMQTARIRLILRMMEHSHEANFGYASDDSSAEASIYRTVLARTGLHLSHGEIGQFAEPSSIEDTGLRATWEHVRCFFSVPGIKPLGDIVARLTSPPIGLPDGVVPIIVLAGYKAFGRAVTIRTDGRYVPDILGFGSTRMFLEPDRHDIEVHTDDKDRLKYLSDVADVFAHRRPGPHDEYVRFANDALRGWRSGIAEGATKSKRLTDDARIFLRALGEGREPAELLFDFLPGVMSSRKDATLYASTIKSLEKARNVIDGLVDGYLRDAVDVLTEILRLDESSGVIEGIGAWVRCLDIIGLMARTDLRMTDKAVLRTAGETLAGRYTPEMLARTVSSILLQRGIEKWQDDTKNQLRKELRECRTRLEAAAMDADEPALTLAPVIEARIRHLQDQLDRLKAKGEAK